MLACQGNLSGGKLSVGELVRGEVVRGELVHRGTCPGGTCWQFISNTSIHIRKCTFLTRHIPQPCARRAHRNPPTDIHSRNVGSLYPIPIYFYYKMSVEFINWYWIYSANIWGMYVIWRVSVRPSGAGLGNISGQECTFSYMYTCIRYNLPPRG